jgi:hypothetical protein
MSENRTRTPRWVIVTGALIAGLVVVVAVMHLTGHGMAWIHG